jgi:hypothetical protein
MNRTLLILLLVLSIVILPACVKPVILTPTGDETKYPATKPEIITFSTTTPTDRPYKEIGYVFAQGENWKGALKLAKEKTAEQGGEAIVKGRGSTQVVLTGFILFVPMYQAFFFVEGTVIKYEQP